MNFSEIVKERRSVRTYLKKDVSPSLIYKILEYGNAAPSAGNIQPWEFIIVRDGENKRNIVETTFVGNDETSVRPQEWLNSAPVFIIVCGNKEKVKSRYGKTSLDSLIYLDVSACIENMLLGIVYLGLASCYVSGFRKEELSKVIHLPESHEPIAILPVGYTGEVCFKNSKVDLQDVIHFEKFCMC